MASGLATRVAGAFNAVVYVSAVAGGVAADRFLGKRRAVLLNGSLLALRYAQIGDSLK